MKILIFTEGTIIMHKNALGLNREKVVKQVQENEESVKNYAEYTPIGDSVQKLNKWKSQGIEILYLTSRKTEKEVRDIQNILNKFNFPKGELLFRTNNEGYKDVAERILPDILIEDDCESIGGKNEMTIIHIRNDLKEKIKSIPIKEFGGIDYLPDNIKELGI